MVISDIGSTDNTGLICHTNRPIMMGQHHSGGDWYASDGTRVDDVDSVPGFKRNRGPMIIRLWRYTATDPPSEGMYHCVIKDYRATPQTVYVGLYHSGRGVCIYLTWHTDNILLYLRAFMAVIILCS